MIRYSLDFEHKHLEQIKTGLQGYNLPLTGERDTDKFCVYLFDRDELIASAITEMGWDWVYFLHLCFKDRAIGQILFQELYKHYHGRVCGIKYVTLSETLYEDLLSFGFQEEGRLSHMPLNQNRYVLTNRLLESPNIEYNYQRITSEDPIPEYQNLVDIKREVFHERHHVPHLTTSTVFVAKDDSDFVGGVLGIIEGATLYIRLLFVEEAYRTQGVGHELMKRVENYAKTKGVETSYVSTTSFQAKDFYLKQGYTLDVIVKDKPKGFDEYTFSKEL